MESERGSLMAPVQDFIGTYTGQHELGYAGQIAESQVAKDVASRAIETAAVGFGIAVGAGTADGSAKLGGGDFQGVTVADKTRAADEYAVGEMAGVMRKGTIWVVADGAVDPTDTVTYTAADGKIGGKAASGSNIVAIPGAKFETTAADGALVRLYLG